MMRPESVSRTDIGRKREENEDSIYADDAKGLYVVCDGMGGHDGGAVASKMARSSVVAALQAAEAEVARARLSPEHLEALKTRVREAIQAASSEIFAANDPTHLRRMGTTLTMVQLIGPRALVAHVGDSRVYLYRQGQLHLMTADHTGAAELMRGLNWTEAQAAKSPLSSILTRAVGTESTVEPDITSFDIFPGDILLLCSDGLTHYVHDRAQLAALLDGRFENTADVLIDRANEEGGRDNISAIVVRFEPGEDPPTVPDRFAEQASELEALAQAFGFEALQLRPLLRLLNLAEKRELETEQTIVEAGAPFDRLVLVVSGALELELADGQRMRVEPGQSVGRRLLFEPGPVQSTLLAKEGTSVLEIDSHRFWSTMRVNPVLSLKVLSRAAWLGHRRVQRLLHEGLDPEPEDLF